MLLVFVPRYGACTSACNKISISFIMARRANATSSRQLFAEYFAVAEAARPGRSSACGVTTATWINEEFPSCGRTNSLQRAEQEGKNHHLPMVSPSRWVQPPGSALLQRQPSIFCSPSTALSTLTAVQSREHFVGSLEILGAKDSGCEHRLQSPSFIILLGEVI